MPVSESEARSSSGLLSRPVSKVLFCYVVFVVVLFVPRVIMVSYFSLSFRVLQWMLVYSLGVAWIACAIHLVQRKLWPLQPHSLHFTRAYIIIEGGAATFISLALRESFSTFIVGFSACFLVAAVSLAHWYLDVRSRLQSGTCVSSSCVIVALKVFAFYVMLLVAWALSCFGFFFAFHPREDQIAYNVLVMGPCMFLGLSCCVHLLLGSILPLQPHSLHFARALITSLGAAYLFNGVSQNSVAMGVTTCLMLGVWSFAHWFLDVRGNTSRSGGDNLPDDAELHLVDSGSAISTLAPAQPTPADIQVGVMKHSVPVAAPLHSLVEQHQVEQRSLLQDQDLC